MIGQKPPSGTGKGFKGALSYLMRGKKHNPDPDRVAFFAMRNLIAVHPDAAPREMRATASQALKVQKPLYHYIIAWRPDEAPSDEVMTAVANRTCRELGLDEHQAVYVAHNDTDHRHIHIVVNRVHPSTFKTWHASNDYARIEQSLAAQSRELGYEPVPGRHSGPEQVREEVRHGRRATNGEYQKNCREAGRPPRHQLSLERAQELAPRLAPLFDEAGSWDELGRRLKAEGVTLERKGQGLILVTGDGTLKLSQLGRQIRYVDLKRRFGEYASGGTAAPPPAAPKAMPPRKRRKVWRDEQLREAEDEDTPADATVFPSLKPAAEVRFQLPPPPIAPVVMPAKPRPQWTPAPERERPPQARNEVAAKQSRPSLLRRVAGIKGTPPAQPREVRKPASPARDGQFKGRPLAPLDVATVRPILNRARSWSEFMRGLRSAGYRLIAGRDGHSVVREKTRSPLQELILPAPSNGWSASLARACRLS